ncbi:PTS sugar transporter subunit IIC [Xylocopilactobacillus apicola]|uniref:Permease IIC component n=1 Tax=Xylocopilactobacillus apicola TaxID=2932184 RepID=A0AAU9D4M2_9LACO|nr:PTS sugar transporter subunit IIC [Xylocopilactobacillus apicola]BDR58719.1 permease IIC component [Xylocopilactobacillus apicola]
MNSFINWLNKHLVPVAAKIGQIRWLVALRDAFIAMMPATMVGSVASVFNALIRDIPTRFGWTGFVKAMDPIISINAQVWTGSMAILGLIFAFTFGYHLSVQYKVEPITGGIVTLGTFIMALPQSHVITLKSALSAADSKKLVDAGAAVDGKTITSWGFFNFNSYFGSNGFFTIMILGGLAAAVYIWFMHKNITIKMPDSVPPAIANAFTGIIPAIASLYVSGIVTFVVNTMSKSTVIELIINTIQAPLLKMSQGYGAVLLMTVLVQVFWFFGIHGTNVLGPILDSIWLTAQLSNIAAAKAGQKLPYFWTRNAFDLYAWIGGAGSTLLLLIAILMFSTRDDQRAVAKMSIGPGFFNINEPAMFGLPIVLDPLYFIPFVIAPVVMVTIAYFALSAGLVSPIKYQYVWSMPIFINSIFATFDWRAPILQLINAIIGFGIYIPFVKAANKVNSEESHQD